MKMGKKVREYKSGDFIFAKVKGYPAWPARVQRMNGKKYFVYFYGTGETANLPPNMIFDYAENKDKFLTKTQKRRDFNDGVKQIEYDFANNVPLEQVIGVPMEVPVEANDSALDSAFEESVAEMTANDTLTNNTTVDETNTTQECAVEDSDDAGNLVIDEGKTPAKGRKSTAKTPAKEAPKAKEAKTPRGKKKEEIKEDEPEKEKKEEEIVSRSGRKIRPKRYIDEETEEASTQSPAKKRRGASPQPEKEKEKEKDQKDKDGKGKTEKNFMQFNAVKQSEIEGLKEPYKSVDEEKDNILIAYLPDGSYVGIKLFQSRPASFKNEQAKLQWDKQAASNAITLKYQLEREQITPESVQGQLVMDLNLTDEEKANLDKERETEEKKARLQFLKTEMRLIELDSKIKTCLSLEKANTEKCLKLLDDLLALFTAMEVRPLMLLKHPTCLETVKRMRAYVGNTLSWDLNEKDAMVFNKQAHKIRKKADTLYQTMKGLFKTPEGLTFWEYFSEQVVVFKKATSNLNATELLEMVHEPIEMTQPGPHTLTAAIEKVNKVEATEEETPSKKKKATPAKKPAVNSIPSKGKRQSARRQQAEQNSEETDAQKEDGAENDADATKNDTEAKENDKEGAKNDAEATKKDEGTKNVAEATKEDEESKKDVDKEDNRMDVDEEAEKDTAKESEVAPEKASEIVDKVETNKNDTEQNSTQRDKTPDPTPKENDTNEKLKTPEKSKEDKKEKSPRKRSKEDKNSESDKSAKDDYESAKETDKSAKETDKSSKQSTSKDKSKEQDKKDKRSDKNSKDADKNCKENAKEDKAKDSKDVKDEFVAEPKAKRTRETKKTDATPPRSPAKRKSKF